MSVCASYLMCCFTNDINKSEENVLVFFSFFCANLFRPKEKYPNWPTTPRPFIRRSFLSLVEFSRVILPEINPAVMLCTSSTQSLNSGTNPSWRGTDLCHGLGQSFPKSHTLVNQMVVFQLKFLLFCMEKPLRHADVTKVGYIRWTEDGHLLKRSPHFRSG